MRPILFIILFIPALLLSQTEKKEKFIKENFCHFKFGATFNNTNEVLFKLLNASETDVFTPHKNIYYNPSVDIEFENHFSRYVGLSMNLGFMQTRQKYHYTNTNASPVSSNNNPHLLPSDGLVLSNIPHLNIAPTFYITNDTRIYVGFGLYKYYYHFNPIQIGSFGFNLNAESLAIYSNISISQKFDFRRFNCSVTISYFGLTKSYDSGIQLGLGVVL
ncbi:MAG: hypothetical protein H7141_11255 [Burkholderiales bacterium]|nr:hypothetical protein [Bacteroidia bacterium]